MKKSKLLYPGILAVIAGAIGATYTYLQAEYLKEVELDLERAVSEVDDLKLLIKEQHLRILGKDVQLLAANIMWFDSEEDTGFFDELTEWKRKKTFVSGYRYFSKSDFDYLVSTIKKNKRKRMAALAMVAEVLPNATLAFLDVDRDYYLHNG